MRTFCRLSRSTCVIPTARQRNLPRATANPTPTVGGYSATDGDEPLFYCVDKAAFDALTDEQKAEYWLHVTTKYNMGEVPCTIPVGEYYAYARIPESDNYAASYTAITPETAFTVKKAVLHYDAAVADNLWAVFNYHNSGIRGGINLGTINITTKDFSLDTELKDRTGAKILGQYVWADSSVFIDSDDSGKTFAARYELNSDCEASYTVEDDSIPVKVTINKGSVRLPALGIPDNKLHAANEGFGPYPDNALPYVVVNDIGGYNVHIYNEWDENTMQVSVAVDDGKPTNALVVNHSDNDYCVVIPPSTREIRLIISWKRTNSKDLSTQAWGTARLRSRSYPPTNTPGRTAP